MTDDTQDESPRLSAVALQEWAQHVECVMRGIAHALNNRAAALSAVLELSRDAKGGSATAILGSELERMKELVRVVRLIGTQQANAEAFVPRDAADDALAVLRLHADQMERSITIDAASAPPARVPRWMFVRSLVALAATASNGTSDPRAPIRIALVGEGDWLVARQEGHVSAATPSTYASEMARAMGGELLDGRRGFRVPSLASLRRREGR